LGGRGWSEGAGELEAHARRLFGGKSRCACVLSGDWGRLMCVMVVTIRINQKGPKAVVLRSNRGKGSISVWL